MFEFVKSHDGYQVTLGGKTACQIVTVRHKQREKNTDDRIQEVLLPDQWQLHFTGTPLTRPQLEALLAELPKAAR